MLEREKLGSQVAKQRQRQRWRTPLVPGPALLCSCTTLLPTPTLNPFWRQLQMELEIMQLEICSARCCVKTPERVPSPPSVCLTLLALSLYWNSKQKSSSGKSLYRKAKPNNLLPSLPLSHTVTTLWKKGVTMLNKSEKLEQLLRGRQQANWIRNSPELGAI